MAWGVVGLSDNQRTGAMRLLRGLLVIAAILAIDLLSPRVAAPSQPLALLDAGSQSLSLASLVAQPAARWRTVVPSDLNFAADAGREVWLRLPVPPQSPSVEQVAEIKASHLRQVDFYLMEGMQLISSSFIGMDRPFTNRPHRTSFQTFDFAPSPTIERTLYIRAYSEVSLSLPISIYTTKEYNDQALQRTIVCCVLFGVFIGIVIYNMFLCVSLRDRYFFYYCAAQIIVLILGFFLTGVVQVLVPSVSSMYSASMRVVALLLLMIYSTLALFIQRYASLKQTDKLANAMILPFVTAMLCLVVPTLTMPLYLVIETVVFIGISAAMAVLIGNIIKGRTDNAEGVFLPFVGLFGFEALNLATARGLLPVTNFSEYAIILGGVWEALFFSLALANRIQSLERERKAIIQVLKGHAPASELNALLGQSFARTYTPNETNVSIMFIDVVGFSQIAELLGSQRMFKQLSSLMQDVTTIVADCRGTVDRSLGDGVLCFFGYHEGMDFRHHAQDAFIAAKRIQEHIVKISQKNALGDNMILPVRIGLHVADVLIGDLGGVRRIDFTMIGSGVNFASRLETACSPFKIMLSQETHRHLTQADMRHPGFSEILVAVKHQEDLVKAFEYNPFVAKSADLEAVEALHLEQLHLKPQEGRYAIASTKVVNLVAAQSTFRILDFSNRGFRALASTYVGRRVTLQVDLQTFDPLTNERLRKLYLHSFSVEVRWSRGVDGGYEHGLKIIGLNGEQRQQIFSQIEALYQPQQLVLHTEDNALTA